MAPSPGARLHRCALRPPPPPPWLDTRDQNTSDCSRAGSARGGDLDERQGDPPVVDPSETALCCRIMSIVAVASPHTAPVVILRRTKQMLLLTLRANERGDGGVAGAAAAKAAEEGAEQCG